jgi:5-methyltetrahydrofolate--homocysteine methyltransferase
MAVSADPSACLVTIETIRLVREKLGLNITQGASNISFGLPGREHLNNAHMALSIWSGLTCPIANPGKISTFVRAVDLVRNRDDFAMRFVEHWQKMNPQN